MKNFSYFILLFFSLSFMHSLSAQEIEQSTFTIKKVQPLQKTVKPGEKAWLAITLKMEEHWHIYWLNAGASGMSTTFTSENELKTKLHFPIPKIHGTGDSTSYGYEKEVTLFLEVDIPKEAKGNLEVKGLLNLLSCNGEGCLPGEAQIIHNIKISPNKSSDNQQLLTLKKKLPTTKAPKGWEITDVKFNNNKVSCTVKAPQKMKFTIIPMEDGAYLNKHQFEGTDAKITFQSYRETPAGMLISPEKGPAFFLATPILTKK